MQPNVVRLNGFDLNAITYLEIDKRQPNDLPDRNVIVENTARGHGSKVVQSQYVSKKLRVLGHIIAPSRTELDLAFDQLKYRTQGTEMSLDMVQGGVLRTYEVTLESGGGGIDYTIQEAGKMTFTLNFMAANPFGRDTLRTTLGFSNPNTTSPNDEQFTFGGSWLAQPEIFLTLNSVTGGTNGTIAIINPATGEQISVTRNWTAGNIFYIDTANKIVTVNNVPTNYNGLFPQWESRDGIIRITDTFSARNYTLAGNYFKRYI